MEVAKKQISKNRVKFAVKIDSLRMDDLFEEEFQKLSASVSLPGFRPGKAPRVMAIESIGHNRIVSYAVERALDEGYRQALGEHKMFPVSQPAVSVVKHPSFLEGADNELEFEIEFDVLPEAKIGDYKKIKIEKIDEKKLAVTEEEVDRVIDYLSKQASKLEPKDSPITQGDWAELNFSGAIKGVKKDALSSDNFPFVVGETKMIDGFTEQIIGMKKGDKKDFELKIPKDIPDKDIAGKQALFSVEIVDSKDIIGPKLDSVFAEKFGHKSVSQLRNAIKESLIGEKREKEVLGQRSKISEQIIKLTKVDVPKSLVENESHRLKHSLEDNLKNSGQTVETYRKKIGMDEKKFDEDLEDQAKKNIMLGVGLSEIAKAEKIEVSDKQGTDKVFERIVELCAQ